MYYFLHHFYPEWTCLISGTLVSCISTPFDVIKNYWIYNPHLDSVRTRVSLKQVLLTVYRRGGIKAFYIGFPAACFTIIPANYIFFQYYERFIEHGIPAVAGIKARGIAVILTAPCEYIRTRLQANAGNLSTRDLLKNIKHYDGFRALTRGIFVTLLRDVPFSAVYWTLNEKSKTFLINAHTSIFSNNLKISFIYSFISGALSAAIASTLTQPLDVIKTNIQGASPARHTLYQTRQHWNAAYLTASNIYRSQGYRGFYVGLTPRLVKIIPSCAILLASHDFFKALHTLWHET